ncbi:Uncharacterised protein at_DN1464 [Pycnogonum litorale]
MPDHDNLSYANLIEKLDDHFIGKSNKTFERHVFRKMQQKSRTFDEFIIDLRKQATKCEFENKLDENICDQLIVGISNNKLREKLLVETEISLDKAVKICKAHENPDKQLKSMTQNTEMIPHEINAVQRHNRHPLYKNKKNQGHQKMINNCSRCGLDHPVNKCHVLAKFAENVEN